MGLQRRINKAPHLPLEKGDFYVALFDWHLGIGNNADNAIRFKKIIRIQLAYYLQRIAKFITGGDWWDLWECRHGEKIYYAWKSAIEIIIGVLAYVVLGNHDAKLRKFLGTLGVPKALVGDVLWIGRNILLFHGHQYDIWNKGGILTKIIIPIVRYFWVFVQIIGFKHRSSFSPTSSLNTKLSSSIKAKAIMLAKKLDCVVIMGHRHRPELDLLGGNAVLIDGGCYGEYAVEIMPEKIELVQWDRNTSKRKVIGTYCMPEITGTISIKP